MHLIAPALVAFLCCVQEEIPVEELFSKIEARIAPIEALTADVSIRAEEMNDQGVVVMGRMEFARGKSFRRSLCLWAAGQGMLIHDEFFSPNLAGVKSLFSAKEMGAFYFAAKIDPGKPVMPNLGMMDTFFLMFGSGWNLTDVALYPRQIGIFGSLVKASRRKEGDREYVALSVQRQSTDLFGGARQPITMTWLFDAATYRLEKMEVEVKGKKSAAECAAYVTVSGVEIPQRVVLKAGFGFAGDDGVEIAVTNLRTSKEAPALPAWLSDSAVPYATIESADEIRARLKKDPKNAGLALSLSGALMPMMMDRGGMNSAVGEACEALQRARESALDSAAVAGALYCAYLGKQDADSAEKLAASLVEKKTVCPDVHVVRAMNQLAEGKYPEFAASVERLGSEGVYGALAAPLRLLGRAATAPDAPALAAILEESCRGKSAPERIELLGAIEPPASRRGRGATGALGGKTPAFLEALAAVGKPEAVLLAARAYSRSGEFKKAADLYLRLAGEAEFRPHLQSEFQGFCSVAKGDAAKLIEAIFEEMTDVPALAVCADAWLEGKEEAKFDRAVKRILQVLTEEKKSKKSRRSSWRDPEPMKALLKKLAAAERIAVARDLLVAYADKNNASSFLYDNDKFLEKILGTDDDLKYDFAKKAAQNSYMLQRLSLTPAAALAILRKRMESDQRDESDVEMAATFVGDDQLRKEANVEELIAFLEKGAQGYPDRPEFHERLGDAYVFGKQYSKAVASYTETLRRKREALDESSRDRVYSVSSSTPVVEPGRQEDPFKPSNPVVFKLAYAQVKNQQRDAAVKAVEQFVKDFTDETSMEGAAQAYELLELPDRILPLRKKIFLAQWKRLDLRRDPWSSRQVLDIAVRLGRLYLGAKRLEEAYAASELALELSKSVKDQPQLIQEAEELRAEIVKEFGEEDLIKGFCAGAFPEAEEKTRLKVGGLVERLDEESPFDRQEAEDKLRAMGADITPLLTKALEGRQGESATRIRAMLLDYAKRALREKFLKEQ